MIPETDYKTTQSSSTGKVDDTDDNATDNAAAQEIFGDISDIKDSEAGSDGSEGIDVSTSIVCEREADFQTVTKKLKKDKTKTIRLLPRGKLRNKVTKTKTKSK